MSNYKLQYAALKQRLHQFPLKKFILWTGPPLSRQATNADEALLAQQFFDWVMNTWDQAGDNIFMWDYRSLATDADGYLAARHESFAGQFSSQCRVCPERRATARRRMVDVIEGRGDIAPRSGMPVRNT